MYFDIVKSTYDKNFKSRIDSELIIGGYHNEEQACAKAKELIKNNQVAQNEFYEVECHNDDGTLEIIIEVH